jgi:hypothetical protein
VPIPRVLVNSYQFGDLLFIKRLQILPGRWFMSVILATWEAEIGRITVSGQPEKIAPRSHL